MMRHGLWQVACCCLLFATATSQYYDHVSVYRCADDSLLARVRIDYYGAAEPVVWNPRNNRLYVTSYAGLYVLDCSTDMLVDSEYAVAMPYCAPALDTTDNKLYCPTNLRINVYDCDAESVTARITTQDYPAGAVWSAAANKVYVSFDNYWDGVVAIDCRTDSVLKYIPVSGGARDLCVRGTGDKVYLGGDHLIGVIDVATDSLVRVIRLPDSPTWLAMNPVTDRLVAQDWWEGTFVLDCAGDTVIDSLPYNVADLGAVDTRTNRLYLFLGGNLCSIDMETGLILDTVMTGRANRMVLDTTDNKAYALMSEYPYQNDTVWVVDVDSCRVLRVMTTQEYSNFGVIWNPLMNKVYIGSDVAPPGVSDAADSDEQATRRAPTFLSGPFSVQSLSSKVIYDAMGRRVMSAKPGVYFVREELQASSHKPQAVRKVIIQR